MSEKISFIIPHMGREAMLIETLHSILDFIILKRTLKLLLLAKMMRSLKPFRRLKIIWISPLFLIKRIRQFHIQETLVRRRQMETTLHF